MKLHILLGLIFVLSSPLLMAVNFKGQVTDERGNPLEEALIYNESQNSYTYSNGLGMFELQDTYDGDTISISYIGYQKRKFQFRPDIETIFVLPLSNIQIEEIIVQPKFNGLSNLAKIDIVTSPVNSSQDLLQKVPGMVIGQHAGGGKAEQIFLRGFDIDHGTDINLTVDGMPVNMVSHAHGQGYSDLHFVIPELVHTLDFGKGPYNADKGNFATAGYVDFRTKKSLTNNEIKLEIGQFDNKRIYSQIGILNKQNHKLYAAGEFYSFDGPYESPQDFHRINVFSKYTGHFGTNDFIELSMGHFDSKWSASGQIPVRAVESGLITRWGAIDDTEGGLTSRTFANLHHSHQINAKTFLKNQVFYSHYDFELYSNFTFFLEDEVNGDQIKQKESRNFFGLNSTLHHEMKLEQWNFKSQYGIGLRTDIVKDNELSHTLNKTTIIDPIRLGNINETNSFAFADFDLVKGKLTINPSLRFDHFNFQYEDVLEENQTSVFEEQTGTLSPKLNFFYQWNQNFQLYLKTGKGFHSNDTRVSSTELVKETLPSALGSDLGFVWKPSKKMYLNFALWYLHLEQEFVYVGDAGIVEPSGKTQRSGMDWSMRYQVLPSLHFNVDGSYTIARSLDVPKSEAYIPLAPSFVANLGLSYKHSSGLFADYKLRMLADRPADEFNDVKAEGYHISDLNIGYQWKQFAFGVFVQNLFNQEWKETQFLTESRLKSETQPVEEIHFIPGTPFNLRFSVAYKF